MEKMIVREPQLNQKNMHPSAKIKYNQMMQEPLPLTYKLHEWPTAEVKAKMDAAMAIQQKRVDAGDIEQIPQHVSQSAFVPLNEPLGPLEQLPFNVERTHKGNLPVYTDTRAGGQRKVTVVRKILGDLDSFKLELSKIVSNAPIEEKMGRLEISGFHT